VNGAEPERIARARRVLDAAGRIHEQRAALAPSIAEATGLSSAGVELGFAYLERDAPERDLATLVSNASRGQWVHVVLSANVFVAPVRALVLAAAAASKVTVRPSPRDPTLAAALVLALDDPSIRLARGRDVSEVNADVIHVYGRDATIAAVRRSARTGTRVVGHGAGLGVVVLSRSADLDAAASAMAADFVAFDQRGCLSPRIVWVEGDSDRARRAAVLVHEELARWGHRVPRGRLDDFEREQARQWLDTLAFAGHLWLGADHAVGLLPGSEPTLLGPPGRHVQVAHIESLAELPSVLEPIARFVVAVGSDSPAALAGLAPEHARISALGQMQRPPLDGPVDRRLGETLVHAPHAF
jgi:hypothetical protein